MNMNTVRAMGITIAAFLLAGAVDPAGAASPVSLPWSTTFNCPEWTQSDGISEATVNCDSMKGRLDTAWCDDGNGTLHGEQITSVANHAAGGGGRGQRHWRGYEASSVPSNSSGGISISFATAQPEIWVRWYMRYQAGFKWSSILEDKIIYFDVLSRQTSVIVAWQDFAYSKILAQSAGSRTFLSAKGKGWTGTMKGEASDGLWHLYEVHLKMDTDGANGEAHMWIDGVQAISKTGIDWGSHPGWSYILFGSNSRYPNNPACFAADYDDIAVSNTGYIGPLSGMTSKPTATTLNPIP